MNTKNDSEIVSDDNWLPKLSSHIRIVDVENGYVLNQTILGYQVSVNVDTLRLLQKLDGLKTIDEIALDIGKESDSTIDPYTLRQYLVNSFLRNGFIESSLQLKKRTQASFLQLKVPLVSKNIINKLNMQWTGGLFHVRLFYPIFLFLFGLNLYLFIHFSNVENAVGVSSPLIFLGLVLSHFVHEWGHALAAKRHGVVPGDIGLGLYYILPVFYVDLSDAWNCNRNERIIINLSGIYIEYILSSIGYLIFFISGNVFFLLLSMLIFIKSWYNLNPFLRTDLYWVLSDYFNKPNLNENAIGSLKTLMMRFNDTSGKEKKKLLPLSLYGIGIFAFWGYIMGNFFVTGKRNVQSVPELCQGIFEMVSTNEYNLKVLFFSIYNLLFTLFAGFIAFKFLKYCYSVTKGSFLKWKIIRIPNK